MRHHCYRLALALLAVGALATSAQARGWCFGHGCYTYKPLDCCEYQTVERTVYVPVYETERRTITVTRCRPEVRERTVVCYKHVPETHEVTRECTIMVPEHRTRTVHYTVAKPVFDHVEQTYTVMVPHQEQRHGVRTVCRPVPVTRTRTICEDHGHWEVRTCGPSCGHCGGGCCHHRVWVPNIVERQVEYTVMKPEYHQQPYEYTVTVCTPETRTRTVRVCRYEHEPRTREVSYVVPVPKTELRTFHVTTCKAVPVEKVQRYTVMVPYTQQREVDVPVCRWVPKTVTCKVPVHCSYPVCGHGYACCW